MPQYFRYNENRDVMAMKITLPENEISIFRILP